MMAAWDTVAAAAVPSVIAGLVALYARQATKKAARIRADETAYDRAMLINKDTVAELERQIRDTRIELNEVRTELNAERRKTDRLISELRTHDIPLPEWI